MRCGRHFVRKSTIVQLLLLPRRLFDPIVENTSSLLEGDHTRRIKKATPTRGGLMGFVKVTQRCIGCRANLDDKQVKQDHAALCINCKPREAELYLGKLAQLQQSEKLFWQIFVVAQRVQSDNLKDVLGIARDSPLYYQMKKVQIDLKEAREQLARFDDGA